MKQITKNEIYKHYIALDWSKVNFALASIRDAGTKYKVVEHPADLKLLKQCLKQLPGKKIMTIEETTSPAVVGVPKSLLKRYEDFTVIVQTFWSPTTKASDKEAV